MTRKIEIPWHGPVAGAIADAVTEQILEQDTQSLVQGIDASWDGELHATVGGLDVGPVYAAAFEALCEHRPEEIPEPAEAQVVGVDVLVEESSYVAVSELDGGDA